MLKNPGSITSSYCATFLKAVVLKKVGAGTRKHSAHIRTNCFAIESTRSRKIKFRKNEKENEYSQFFKVLNFLDDEGEPINDFPNCLFMLGEWLMENTELLAQLLSLYQVRTLLCDLSNITHVKRSNIY